MKWLNSNRVRIFIVGIVAEMILGGASAKADFTFGEPVNLGPTINSSSPDVIDFISSDGLVMYLDSPRPGGYGNWDIWVSTRETLDDDWGAPVNLGPPVNTAQDDLCAYISADGLEMYFTSSRSGGYGSWDIWITRRATRDAVWGTPQNLGPLVNSSASDGLPWISTDGLELYFRAQNRMGGYGHDDIWVSRRSTVDSPWGEPVNLGPVVNSSASECCPVVSSEGLVLFFSEDILSPLRPGGLGNGELWVTRRASVSDPWGSPLNLGPMINTSHYDGQPRLSLDDSMLYFCSERPGGFGGMFGDIYQAPIIPIVDFNGDGRVDGVEFTKIVDHWGQNESLFDMGPTPLGDGTLDVQDLIVLAEYIGQDIDDPTLVAHWALDETEGNTAFDSARGNHATVMGGAAWQPTGGIVDGALLLDGGDDCVVTEYVRDPSDGFLSVFMWIKGGGPGQVVVSQVLGDNWLLADSSSGNLMTDLKESGRSGRALLSETLITDGNWHRVGLVWDGANRILYVDDVVAAKDTQSDLVGSNGGLNIGGGSNLEPGSFWSGLIDDVRIYNRAVKP